MVTLEPIDKIECPAWSIVMRASRSSVDEMANMLQLVQSQISRLRNVEYELRHSIGELAKREKKTERVQGETLRVKVEWPDDYWSQTILKEVWEQWDEAPSYLRIGTIAPNLREIKKLESTNGSPTFNGWRDLLLRAREPSKSPPTVKIEE